LIVIFGGTACENERLTASLAQDIMQITKMALCGGQNAAARISQLKAVESADVDMKTTPSCAHK
jgi:hypothetical protein